MRALFHKGDGWAHSIHYGRMAYPIATLTNDPAHWALEVRGNKATGWAVYMEVHGTPDHTAEACQVSPLFLAEAGDTRRMLIEACQRAYGVAPRIAKREA
jgi:hypothetical protein